MKKFIPIAFIITLIACSGDDEITETFSDCQHLENYKRYSGEDVGCKFHFTLTSYKGQQYLELNNHCADLSRSYVINGNCEDICEDQPYGANSKCSKYLAEREVIEVYLIEK